MNQAEAYESMREMAQDALDNLRMANDALAQRDRRIDAALTAIAAFNLNGVAPRDKLGAALDCIAAVRKALEAQP